MNTVRYTNITQIKQANRDAGYYWFSPDTVRFFDSRVESRVYTSTDGLARLWVESTTNWDDSAREFKLSRFDVAAGSIDYVADDSGDTLRFDSVADARDYLPDVL